MPLPGRFLLPPHENTSLEFCPYYSLVFLIFILIMHKQRFVFEFHLNDIFIYFLLQLAFFHSTLYCEIVSTYGIAIQEGREGGKRKQANNMSIYRGMTL